MRKLMWVLALVWVPVLAGQQDSTPPPDSTERERLQQQIEDRFAQVVQQQ